MATAPAAQPAQGRERKSDSFAVGEDDAVRAATPEARHGEQDIVAGNVAEEPSEAAGFSPRCCVVDDVGVEYVGELQIVDAWPPAGGDVVLNTVRHGAGHGE